MSEFKVNLTAANPKEEDRRTPPVEALVDTGAHSSWLPRRLLLNAGITPHGKVQFQMANKQLVEREVGYAILSAEGYSTIDEVVFAEDSDMSLLGLEFCGAKLLSYPVQPDSNYRERQGGQTVSLIIPAQRGSSALIYPPPPPRQPNAPRQAV